MFSFNEKQEMDPDDNEEIIFIQDQKPNYFLFDIFYSNNTFIDFSNYYRKALLSFKSDDKENKFIPFENYEKHEEYKHSLTIQQGTQRDYYDKTLDYRIEGKVSPKIKGNFIFEKYFLKVQKLIFSFELKKNPIYPKTTNFIQRKQIFSEIKSLLSNYIFIQKGFTIISPPIREDEDNTQLNFIVSRQILNSIDYSNYFPFYSISYDRFYKFLNKFFNLSKNASMTLKNIIKNSPYLLQVFSNELNQNIEIMLYDKALLLFKTIFLDDSEIDAIQSQLIYSNNFQITYLNPDEDQRRQIVNKIIQMSEQTLIDYSNFDVFLKKNSNFQLIDINEIIQNQELLFQQPIKMEFKNEQEYVTTFVLTFNDDKVIEYMIPLELENCQKLEINVNDEHILTINMYEDEFFNIKKVIIVTDQRLISLSEKNLKKNLVLFEKSFNLKYKVMNFHVLNQEEFFAGFLVTYNKDELQIAPDEFKEEFLMPIDFQVSQFQDLDLRFDISFFNKEQFTLYKNSISVLKYDLESYLKNCNLVIDFLEKLFPQCSIYTNFFKPKSIGDFHVFVVGFGDKIPGSEFVKKNKLKKLFQNKYTLFSNQKINQFPTSEELFDNFCYLLIKNGKMELLCDKQRHYLIKNNVEIEPEKRERVKEEVIQIDEFLINKKKDYRIPHELQCANFGCNQKFIVSENDRCFAHNRKWDFGHTGVTIEETLNEYKKDKSKKILWKPHWTCCGKQWDENCSIYHLHNGVDPGTYKGENFDINDKNSQRIFKKNISDSWAKQLKKFEIKNKKQLNKKILKLAKKIGKEVNTIPIESLPKLCDALI